MLFSLEGSGKLLQVFSSSGPAFLQRRKTEGGMGVCEGWQAGWDTTSGTPTVIQAAGWGLGEDSGPDVGPVGDGWGDNPQIAALLGIERKMKENVTTAVPWGVSTAAPAGPCQPRPSVPLGLHTFLPFLGGAAHVSQARGSGCARGLCKPCLSCRAGGPAPGPSPARTQPLLRDQQAPQGTKAPASLCRRLRSPVCPRRCARASNGAVGTRRAGEPGGITDILPRAAPLSLSPEVERACPSCVPSGIPGTEASEPEPHHMAPADVVGFHLAFGLRRHCSQELTVKWSPG